MISCHSYDYIEIACMFAMPVTLTLEGGEQLHGIAKDTARNQQGEECIALHIEGSDEAMLVVLDHIKVMESRVTNPHFTRVELKT